MRVLKYEFYLDGLGCANCAAKMEKRINELEEVNFASIDFVNKKLIIDTEEKNYNNVSKKAEEIIKSIESHVNLISHEEEKHLHEHSHSEAPLTKEDIIKYTLGITLFIAMLFIKNQPLKLAMAFISYILIGGDIVVNAFKNIYKGQVFDENFLMTVATFGAFLIGEYPEAISVMLFYKIGETLQDMAVDNSRKSIKSLLQIKAEYANLVINNDIKNVSPKELKIGDIVLVKAGERVPIDGVVIEGKSSLDTSALTGESMPRFIEEGREVLSGSINLDGVIKVKATKSYQNSTVQRIMDLVENATQHKAKTEKFITKFARYYTPIVVLLALIIAVIPPFLGYGDFSKWVYRALIFLVVSCPCALVISIPLSFFSGIGLASKKGILIKGSNYIEALSDVESIVFDKTGTLTEGRFKVDDIVTENNFTKEDVLKYASYVESLSNHPIAKSIVDEYEEKIDSSKISGYREIPGFGVEALVEDKKVVAGNKKLMEQIGLDIENINKSGTIVYISIDSVYAGYIEITDVIKSSSKETIKRLNSFGISTYMLTGDNIDVAQSVAKEIGIKNVYANLLPQDKVEKLKEIKQSSKCKVVFVGDGINDAPVLTLADVGIAMGALGQDAAIEAADVVITTDEIDKVYEAVKLSKFTRKIVVQNILLALGIKILVLILATFGLSNMWEAVFADVGVALLAVLNSRRIVK
ncbi:MAG: heavy metal translocating P-type ATPase [Clostridiales bacterium]|nr:heavy metal translocating P-type ATPase [Clostridiales bacterium]